MPEDSGIAVLRARRAELSRSVERARSRASHGMGLASALGVAAGETLSLADFKVDPRPPFDVFWRGDAREAPGLVSAYIDKHRARQIVHCMELNLSDLGGRLGIYGNDYLGLCEISRVSIAGMLEAAEAINDSIVFYPRGEVGAVVVDCYVSNAGPPFSLLVQGDAVVEHLKGCFV